jgi:hypothetical protein
LRQSLCCFLILTLVGLGRPVLAAEQTVQGMKDTVSRVYLEGSKVKVKLKDSSQLKGRISGHGIESFTIEAYQRLQTVSYADVTEVKRQTTYGVVKGLIIVSAVIVTLTILKGMGSD